MYKAIILDTDGMCLQEVSHADTKYPYGKGSFYKKEYIRLGRLEKDMPLSLHEIEDIVHPGRKPLYFLKGPYTLHRLLACYIQKMESYPRSEIAYRYYRRRNEALNGGT